MGLETLAAALSEDAETIEVKPRTRVEIDNVPRADAAARIADLVASERARYAARS